MHPRKDRYGETTNERIEQARGVDQALRLRKRTRRTPVISAETAEESVSA